MLEVVLGLYRMVSNPYFIDTVILFNLARASSVTVLFINYLFVLFSGGGDYKKN